MRQGLAALTFSLLAAVVLSACSNQASSSPPNLQSVHLSPSGANYIGANSRLLATFALGVSKGKITPTSRVALSASNNGVKVANEVWSGKSLQTAKDFNLDYSATYTNLSGVKQLSGSGHLLLTSSQPAPSLTAARGYLLNGQEVFLLASVITNGTTFNAGNDTGGQMSFTGNQFTYIDSQGKLAGQHTFSGSGSIESDIKAVLNANVPPPSAKLVQLVCNGAPGQVANSSGFVLSLDDASSTGHQTIISVSVIKSVAVDCKTNQITISTLVDAAGDIDGKGFLALSSAPPVVATTQPDDSPPPVMPALTNFTPDPLDLNALPLELTPQGKLPSWDGAYSGSYQATGSLTDGTPVNASGPVTFTVTGSALNLTAPGNGVGSVYPGGGGIVTFTIPGNGGSTETSTCTISGSFATTKSASGTMICKWADGNATGPWHASAK